MTLAAGRILAQDIIPEGPFECDGYAYFTQGSPARLYSLDLSTGDTLLLCDNLLPMDTLVFLNALGYNPADHYLWAHRTGTSEMVRIGADCSTTHFEIEGLLSASVFYSGDMDASGIMYLLGTGDSLIYRIDLDPQSGSYLQTLAPIPTPPTSISDWTVNPVDHYLYAIASNYALCRFDPESGERELIGEVTGEGVIATGHYGASFFDPQGHFYIAHNQNGNVFRVESPHLGDTAAVLFASVAASTNNDGAMCSTSVASDIYTLSHGQTQVWPNPCVDEVYVTVPWKDFVQLEVYDAWGRLVLQTIVSGTQTRTLRVEEWNTGVYSFVFRTNKHCEIVKALKWAE